MRKMCEFDSVEMVNGWRRLDDDSSDEYKYKPVWLLMCEPIKYCGVDDMVELEESGLFVVHDSPGISPVGLIHFHGKDMSVIAWQPANVPLCKCWKVVDG